MGHAILGHEDGDAQGSRRDALSRESIRRFGVGPGTHEERSLRARETSAARGQGDRWGGQRTARPPKATRGWSLTTWTPPTAGEIERTIQEMVRRIVDGFDPQRIVLLGSQARGDA